MPDPSRSASSSLHRATIGQLAGRHRTRLRWRHVLVVTLATVLLLTGLGGLLAVWEPHLGSQQRIGSSATRAPWTVLFCVAYVAGAVLLSYGLARFDGRRARRRLPVIMLLSIAVLAAVIVVWGVE